MNDREVEDLCTRIVTRWPTVDRDAWRLVLEPVDYDLAERVLIVLRQRLQRVPSCDEFTTECRLQGPDRTRLTPEEIAAGLERVAWLKSVYKQARGVS